MNDEKPEIMTVADVADYLRIKTSTVYEWAANGKLPGVKVGRLWRFERSEIEKWVRENRKGGKRK